MTEGIGRCGAFVICHGAAAPVIERSEVMFQRTSAINCPLSCLKDTAP
jgi:hypothetical protein